MGRNAKKNERPILTEVITSLPGLARRTTRLPPDDLGPDEFVETSTGQDLPASMGSLGHVILGISFWVGWIMWTIYTWFFTGQPFTDLGIAFAIWVFTFVVVILGVPLMRRRARNRIRV